MDHENNNCQCGGMHHDEGTDCCHKHTPMQRFMEACLLVLLKKEQSHGYGLSEHLKEFGFNDINASTLYRIMRKMDEQGWVDSNWEEGDKGPQKRVYCITKEGLKALDEWIGMFRKRRENIDLLLKAYESNNPEE